MSLGRRSAGWRAALLVAASCSGGGGAAPPPCRTTPIDAAGPGDAANVFPASYGDRWIYDVHYAYSNLFGSAEGQFRRQVAVTEERGPSTLAFTYTRLTLVDEPEWANVPEVQVFAKGPSGVALVANGRGALPLEPGMLPFRVLPFPLESGSSSSPVACAGLPRVPGETLDLASEVTVVGAEQVTVPAGSFAATRVDTYLRVTFRPGESVVEQSDTSWYVPDLGRVRSVTTTSSEVQVSFVEESLRGYSVGGRDRGLVRAARLLRSSPYDVGPPALSFDGTRHLVVSGRDAVVADGYFAPTGSFPITDRYGDRVRSAAAFNGASHLVVSSICPPSAYVCDTVFAQRISPAGERLDGAAGFDLAAGDGAVHAPAVASDGSGWLAAWVDEASGLVAVRISAEGTVLGTTLVRPRAALGATDGVAVAFGAGSYLAVWLEGRDLVAARLSPGGAVLDDPPIAVSTAASEKELGGVAFDGAGFVIAWGDARRNVPTIGTPPYDVWAARLSPDGALLDGPPEDGGILVNAYPGIAKRAPAVASDGAGVTIAWRVPFEGIYAAHLDGVGIASGSPVEERGVIVTDTLVSSSAPDHPVVVPAAPGQVLVGWRSEIVDGAWVAR